MGITTGIVLFDDVEELDFAGPWEVLTMSAELNGVGDRVVTIAEHDRPVACKKGLRVVPDYTFADAPGLDILLVPGGEGARRGVENPALIEFVRRAGHACRWVTSVCTGSYLLHAAGYTRGKRITTHWGYVEALRALDDMTVLDQVRYVRDGNLVTAAGVSAGIDMALWLVGQMHGAQHARIVQRAIQYEPAPPYAAEA